jgi:hypothetical protein
MVLNPNYPKQEAPEIETEILDMATAEDPSVYYKTI